MTDLDIYQPANGQLGQYQAQLAMTPEQAQQLDEQVRRCTEAVLREGTDYGIIPGTGGDKTLWRPGAQKLLQWFGLGYTCNQTGDIERDDDGRKLGVTYRAIVARRLPDGSLDVKATCEGYAGYDEDKFCQPAEQVQAKAEARERKFAKMDGRVANPTKWQNLGEYRAPWNSVIKRAQKRAIVGAVNDATAAGGIFTDREEDDSPEPKDDGPSWYEEALEAALGFTDPEAGRKLFVDAAQAARDGLCTPRQATHIQNRITQRARLLKKATPVDAEELAGQAASTAGDAEAEPAEGERVEDEPGTVTKAQLTKLHTVFTKLGFNGEDREQKLKVAEAIAGRAPLLGPAEGRSSKNLSWTEARRLIDTLDAMDRDQLIAHMAEHEDYVRQETSDE